MKNIITQVEEDHINQVCSKYNIKNYTINTDGSIDVDGNVNLYLTKIKNLPIRFNKVSGTFDCSNNSLTTLYGCPTEVGGNFWASNNQITSLEHCPKEVGGTFSCNGNKLTTLEYTNNISCMVFLCKDNELTTLEHCPIKVIKDFNCEDNQITSLLGSPRVLSGYFRCDTNKLTSLEHAPREVGSYFSCDNNPLLAGFISPYGELKQNEQKLIYKYMNYYDVWTPVFNKENMQMLIDDIKDGLL
jgi:hypothetical protein